MAIGQAAQQVSPSDKVEEAVDIALKRPGTYRLHNVEEAQKLFDEQQEIGEGNSIGDVPGYFRNMVYDAEPAILPAGTDTATLQAALDAASTEINGGVVRLEAGDYELGTVHLRSNTRLEIDPGATIKMQDIALFVAGRGLTATTAGRAEQVINFEVTSTHPTEQFTIDASHKKAKSHNGPFLIASAKNFAISNAKVLDNYTILSQVFLIADSDTEVGAKEIDGEIVRNISFDRCPEFGVVQNIEGHKQHTGYGTVQVFCGENLYLADITGYGGVTLRLEPGSGPDHLNKSGKYIGAMRDIKVENITNVEGFTALYLKPHSKEIYNVEAKDIYGIDSGFALMVDYGNQNPDDPYFGRGHFHNTKVSGEISLKKTKDGENSRVGRMALFYIADETRAGRHEWEMYTPDPSGGRWKTSDVVVPVLLASEMTAEDVGDWHQGLYKIDLSEANISGENLIRDELILYRGDTKNFDGTVNVKKINQ
ncbi:hypothetical protein N6L24_11530 [Cognatishimia sp. SS12]|uniref:hypothetical protein n=1 Tax=Cognatishimia sp. SS12 TaxID=2979465 RepID=UPI00232E82E3|nr:hypothetical protein [Cognatishimia sp. SS12]MDC0738911.1 hypothetical protein [Cognatishimia sp. SS12]